MRKVKIRIVLLSLMAGLSVWVIDAISDYFFFLKGETFINVLILHIPPHEIYFRLLMLVSFVSFGFFLAFLLPKYEKLQRKTKDLALFPEENPNPVFRIRGDGKIKFANSSGRKILSIWGVKPDEMAPKRWRLFVSEVLTKGKSETKEERVGGRTFSFTLAPIVTSGYVNVYGRDITDILKTDKSLKQSEERFRLLFQEAPLAYQSLDEKGSLMYVNSTWLENLGYEPEDVIGRSFKDFIDPEYHYVFEEKFPEFRKKGEIHGVQYKLVKKDSSRMFVEFNGKIAYDEDGNFKQTHCIFQDITEKKKAEEKLKSLREHLELQIERMPIGLITWDTDFRVKTWNPAASRIFGFTEEEAIGKHAYELLVPKEAQPHVDDIWKRLLSGDETAHSVNDNITKDGKIIICSWANTPLRKKDGTVVGVLSMVQDVTRKLNP